LLLFETTLVTQRPAPAFSYAVQCGEQNIVEEDAFELAVDIRRARLQRIKPLASVDLPSTAPAASQPRHWNRHSPKRPNCRTKTFPAQQTRRHSNPPIASRAGNASCSTCRCATNC
jgi:hypothetical protein